MSNSNAIVRGGMKKSNLSERARRRRPRRNESEKKPMWCNSGKENLKKRRTRATGSIIERHPWRDGSGNMWQKGRQAETTMTMTSLTIIAELELVKELVIARRKESENNSGPKRSWPRQTKLIEKATTSSKMKMWCLILKMRCPGTMKNKNSFMMLRISATRQTTPIKAISSIRSNSGKVLARFA